MAKQNKKESIFRAAALLFHKKGYAAASMRELASEVGLEASSLYSHIQSKQEILKEICFQEGERFMHHIEHLLEQKQSPLAVLQEIGRFHIQTALHDPIAITVFNDEWKHLEQPELSQLKEQRKKYESYIIQVIEEGIEQGVINQRNSFLMMRSFLSSFKWIYEWKPSHKVIDAESLADELMDIIMLGIQQ